MTAAALAAPLAFAVSGFALVSLVPDLARRAIAERLALGYLAGLAWISGGLFLLSHLFGVPIAVPAIAGLTLLPAAALLVFRRPRRAFPRVRRASLVDGLALAAAVAAGGGVSLAILADALTRPVDDWDGRQTWGPHARYVYAESRATPRALAEARWLVFVPRHPPLLPVAQAAAYALAGSAEDDRAVRPLYAFLLPAFLVTLWFEGARRGGRFAASLVALAAALVPQLTFVREGGAAGIYADLPLASLFGAGALLLLGPRARLGGAAVGGLLLAGGVLAKNEGLPLALAALAVRAASDLLAARRRRARGLPASRAAFGPLLVACAAVGLTVAALASWKSGIPNRLDPNFSPSLTPRVALEGLARRLPALAVPTLEKLHDRERWGYLWVALPLVLWAGRPALGRRGTRRLTAALALAASTYLAVYAATQLNPLWLVARTWDRFLLQLSLPLLVLAAAALSNALKPPRRLSSRRHATPAAALALVLALAVAFFPALREAAGIAPPARDPSLLPPPELATTPFTLDPEAPPEPTPSPPPRVAR